MNSYFICYVWHYLDVSHTRDLKFGGKKMKSKLRFSSLIRVAAIAIVVTLMASLMTDADAYAHGCKIEDTWYGEVTDDHKLAVQFNSHGWGERQVSVIVEEFWDHGGTHPDFIGHHMGEARRMHYPDHYTWEATLTAFLNGDGESEEYIVSTYTFTLHCDNGPDPDTITFDGFHKVYPSFLDMIENTNWEYPEHCGGFSGILHRWQQVDDLGECEPPS